MVSSSSWGNQKEYGKNSVKNIQSSVSVRFLNFLSQNVQKLSEYSKKFNYNILVGTGVMYSGWGNQKYSQGMVYNFVAN